MFDPITAALIRSAPALDGLDRDNLPRRLTEVFASIVSARIRLRTAIQTGGGEDIVGSLRELQRIAIAQEAYVALLPQRENRAAAAFVAASAHQACMLSHSSQAAASRVDAALVTPEICAALLFLVAEANADAAEAGKRITIVPEETTEIETALLQSIRNLAQGRLGSIQLNAEMRMPDVGFDAADRALQGLQLLLLRGIEKLASQLSRRTDPVDAGQSARDIFNQVKELCSEPIEDVFEHDDRVVSLYPGPLHLANLLLTLERDLLGSVLSRVPCPSGVIEQQ